MKGFRKDKLVQTAVDRGSTSSDICLYDAGEEKSLRIKCIKGNRSIRQQLSQIGIQPGDKICIKRRVPFGGALMIENRGSIIALSRGFAVNIMVELLS